MQRVVVGGLALAAGTLVVLASLTTTLPDPDGIWFSEWREGDTVLQEVLEHRPDGRLRIAARTLRACEPRGLVVREGRWTRTEGGFTYRIETIDGAAPPEPPVPQPHALRTLRIDRMTYADAAGRERAALRAPIDFEFPPPADCPQ